jgi:AraC-like DNA-binding protein
MKYLFKNKINPNGILTVSRSSHRSGMPSSLDYHPHYEMYFCEEALEGSVMINDTKIELDCPFVCIYSPFTLHAAGAEHPMGKTFAVYFRRTYWEKFSHDVLPIELSKRNVIFPLAEEQSLTLRGILSALDCEDVSEAEKATIFASFLNALCRMVDDDGRIFVGDANETVSQILKHIYLNISDKLNADDVSKVFHISRAKLDRDFRTYVGTSFHNVVAQCRISTAIDLMADKHYSIGEIGAMVGFENARGFYYFFKRYVGVTPAQYRKDNL